MTGRPAIPPGARLRVAAGRVVPGHSVAVVRIVFGTVAVVSAARILAYGWVGQLWSQPELLLGWPGVAVPAIGHAGLVAVVAVVGCAGLAIVLGVAPRVAAAVFLVAFGYLELLDRTTYLNHYWAMTLLAMLLIVLPSDGTWALRVGRRAGPPARVAGRALLPVTRQRAGVPAWTVWLLRTQVAVVYIGAGLAKLDADWLLRGQPLGMWFASRADLPVLGPSLVLPGAGLVASWAGLAFDLSIVAWLWWRPTRAPAFVAVVAFHAGTWVLFPAIGVFPLLMVGLATVWLPPDWPAAVARRLRRGAAWSPTPTGASSWSPTAATAKGTAKGTPVRPAVAVRPVVAVLASVWMLVQLVVPFRHAVIPGDVRWTEEGGRFAWRVMAEEKVGWATFTLTDPTTAVSERVAITDVLTANQAHVAATRPDVLHQVATTLAERRAAATGIRPRVRVDARVSWNGRPNAPLIDPKVDLAAQPWRHGRHQPWILEPPP